MAVGLFNIGEESAKVSVSLKELNDALKMNLTAGVPVRDIWQLKDLAPMGESFSAEVPRHGMVFLKIGKARAEEECIAELVKANLRQMNP